jgi:hypothetical protein
VRRALLHGSDEVVQGEEQWERGDRAKLGRELDRLRAINEEYDCSRLRRKPGMGLSRSLRMAERPGVEDQHFGRRPWDRLTDEPDPHIYAGDRTARIH